MIKNVYCTGFNVISFVILKTCHIYTNYFQRKERSKNISDFYFETYNNPDKTERSSFYRMGCKLIVLLRKKIFNLINM